jgi:hypothetical protein
MSKLIEKWKKSVGEKKAEKKVLEKLEKLVK